MVRWCRPAKELAPCWLSRGHNPGGAPSSRCLCAAQLARPALSIESLLDGRACAGRVYCVTHARSQAARGGGSGECGVSAKLSCASLPCIYRHSRRIGPLTQRHTHSLFLHRVPPVATPVWRQQYNPAATATATTATATTITLRRIPAPWMPQTGSFLTQRRRWEARRFLPLHSLPAAM